jgi:hypothetical protein
MKKSHATLLAMTVAAGMVSTPALASVMPFTETFADGNANWGGGPLWTEFDPLGWTEGGGPSGANYVTATESFGDTAPGPLDLAIFRGQDNFNSSNGAFLGNWIESNVSEFSFWVRHDASIDLEFFVRFTPTGQNFPSMNYRFTSLVQTNTWTQLSVAISPDTPGWVFGGSPATTYDAVFGNLGKIQIGAAVDALTGMDETYNFDLALVSIAVPAPGVLGLLCIGMMAPRRRRMTRA